MNRTLASVALALVLVAACSSDDRKSDDDDDDGGSGGAGAGQGGSTSSSGGGSSSSSASGGGSGTGGSGTGGSGTGGSGGGFEPLPACYPTCTAATDCVQPNATPLLDADNYACNGGRCEWTGCNTTSECTTTYSNPNYVCAAPAGSSLKGCYPTCATATDCAQPNAPPLLDADNYQCNGGRCEWLGCNTTAECTTTYSNPNYVCAAPAGSSFKSCYPTCATAADCAQASAPPLLDADNYQCNSGRCEYLGCNATSECTLTYMNDGYVCY